MHTVLYAVFGYFFLLAAVRILSRRPGAQLTPFEFVLVFLVGGVIILATVGDDRSVTNCLCGIITIGLMHHLVSYLKQRFPKVGALLDGTPLVLLERGRWQTEVMDRMKLQDTDVMNSARTKGIKSLDEIEYAVLERNGAISILKYED
jgi:uncharacterized membrane protein YcaP (DUF421 family)